MPSDFISLFSGDLDLNSPRSLYSKELQLPFSKQQSEAAMSQTSGGDTGPAPGPAALGPDASTVSSSMSVGGAPCSAFPDTSSSTMHFTGTLAPDKAAGLNSATAEPEDSRAGPPDILGAEAGNGNSGSAGNCRAGSEQGGGGGGGGGGGRGSSSQEQQHQMTPSKRRPVLIIPPPPEDLFDNSCMSLQTEATLDSEQSNSIWTEDSVSNFSNLSSSSYNDNTEVPRKSRKRTPRQRPGPKSLSLDSGSKDMFDADSAKGPHFVLSQLGSDSKPCPIGSAADGPSTTIQKGRILSMQYPSKREGKELKIIVQPETQHRARYLTEGSRGSVKDRTQQGFPTVKLEGVNEPVLLQVFVANDTGRVRPHGFYQACRVTGRNTTACKELDIEGTTVIEVPLDPGTSMTIAVDCVGILKLRNADVEARIGVAGSKKKSTRARLVFRVNVPGPDGSLLTLQTPSSPILCTQPAGLPEILKKSLHSCSVRGGAEVFIIGKNFLKDTKVIFQENISDENSWKEEAEIDMELFHQNHLIVKVPPYQNQDTSSSVCVGIFVLTNAGRSNDVQPFTYTPDPAKKDVSVKNERSSPVKPCPYEGKVEALDPSSLMLPHVKREDITPMDVSSNLTHTRVFKPPTDMMCQARQSADIPPCRLTNKVFPVLPQTVAGDGDNVAPAAAVLQSQDLSNASGFAVPAESLLQAPGAPQPFRMEPRERRCPSPGPVGRLRREPASQQQHRLPLLPLEEIEQAVRQLQATGFYRHPLQSDNAMAEQQQCQQHIQQQQQQQQQIQKQHIHQQQQIQTQHIQQQQEIQKQHIQQQQQQQQQLQQLYQSQIPMECTMFHGTSRGDNAEQQGSPQGSVPNRGSLFQQAQQQTSEQLLPLQTSFLQQTPSLPSPPRFHRQSSMAEAREPPAAVFHAQKASCAQEHLQATLFPNNLTALSGSSLAPEQQQQQQQQQPATSFLPQTSLPSQPQQQQQMAFLNALQTTVPEPQPVFQAQTQLAPIQRGTPMEQQQAAQPQTQSPQQTFQNIPPHPVASTLSPGQQQAGLLFHTNPNLSSQDQPSSLLFSGQGPMPPLSSSSLSTQQPPNPALLFSQASMVPVGQQDRSEPMALGNPSQQRQQVLFPQQPQPPPPQQPMQQPMQLGGSSQSAQQPPVSIFIPQANMAALQGGMAAQELPPATIFSSQSAAAGLQATSSSPPVKQPGSLFQAAVGGGARGQPSHPRQPPGLFLFGMENECSQMMNAPGTSLSDHIIAISQSGQNQRESEAHIQSLFIQSLSESGTIQNTMASSQNMEKMEDLLISLQQEPGNNLTRSY
ncbi:nuclear factor of activated T-cells 5 isoform X2 [Gadus morhua]|uniref:nuclear factor of activated T-cells 5 isoform X2 n=1 Tax=Gadus morhua TaxID=8049 RepID=UPI0011B3D618|nr:nuclear factor of activated T-cells 5-like isoform X2 [Gadus morhua]